jgi:hypothetical protein
MLLLPKMLSATPRCGSVIAVELFVWLGVSGWGGGVDDRGGDDDGGDDDGCEGDRDADVDGHEDVVSDARGVEQYLGAACGVGVRLLDGTGDADRWRRRGGSSVSISPRLASSGGFFGGRTPLGPDPMSQLLLLLIAFMYAENAVNLSAGTSLSLTWLAA